MDHISLSRDKVSRDKGRSIKTENNEFEGKPFSAHEFTRKFMIATSYYSKKN